ncbi:uncharacterized protein LOC132732393 [Ruditapes philippinarum]|uniref:uncharacterized protein LOC132732393 n=1 Tax=Ruditapes philippinarum TaxID=129788 RepID=UPI00295A759A|nr:uncharacterized protein LOC132732393 [Ruditapes philippinarum]
MTESQFEDNLKFSLLIEGVVKKAQIETKNKYSETLCVVIRFYINTWLHEVEQINPLYKVSELIPVGSYAEGTKIIQADEFDYLAVIEELSKPDVIKIDASESDINHSLVKVAVANEKLKLKWSGLCKDGHLQCFQPINFPKENENRFGHVVIETLWKFVKNSQQIGRTTGSPTDIDCKILLRTLNEMSLCFTGALFRAPNVIFSFEYGNRNISVDVSPAIRYHKIHDCFRVDDCAGPKFAELALCRKSLLLVGTLSESYFKVTVTEAEVEYILTVMKPEHKIIYVFLKYVNKLFTEKLQYPSYITLTSYTLKTVCIHHDVKCAKNERSIKECLKSVMNDLNVSLEQYFVASIVNKNINLVKSTERDDKNDRDYAFRGLTKICQLPTEIETVEDFETFMKQIADVERLKKVKAAEEARKSIMESSEIFATELQEKVSNIVAMGFDPDEVKEFVLGHWDSPEDYIIRILQTEWRVRERERKKLNAEEDCSANQGMLVSDSHSVNEKHLNGDVPEELSSQQSSTTQILYQRQKDV